MPGTGNLLNPNMEKLKWIIANTPGVIGFCGKQVQMAHVNITDIVIYVVRQNTKQNGVRLW